MPSLQELFEDIMNFAQEGGPMVESGELRLERQLAEMLNRQAWLDLYHDDRKLFLAHDETEFALFNRDPFSESEVEKLAQAFDAVRLGSARDADRSLRQHEPGLPL